MISFTWRRKLFELQCPNIFSSKILVSTKVKYFVVILDPKLTYKSHLKQVTNKVRKAFWLCRKMFGKTWGLKPVMVHWLYTKVVPTITYAFLVWWLKIQLVYAVNELNKVQRIAYLDIKWTMSLTPTAAMKTILRLLPLQFALWSEIILGAHKGKRSGFLKDFSGKPEDRTSIFNYIKQTSGETTKVFTNWSEERHADFSMPRRRVIAQAFESGGKSGRVVKPLALVFRLSFSS